MSIPISPASNSYALPVVTQPRHTRDQRGNRGGANRREEQQPHADAEQAAEACPEAADSAPTPSVGSIINVRA